MPEIVFLGHNEIKYTPQVKDREGILMRVGDRFGWYCSANWPLERAVMMVTVLDGQI